MRHFETAVEQLRDKVAVELREDGQITVSTYIEITQMGLIPELFIETIEEEL